MSNYCKGSGVGQHEWWQATIAADDRAARRPASLVLYCQRCAQVRSVPISDASEAAPDEPVESGTKP